MSEPLFLLPKAPLSLADVIALTGALPPSSFDPARLFHEVAAPDRAGSRALSAAEDEAGEATLVKTRAGACFVLPRHAASLPAHTIALVTETPRLALAMVVAALYPTARQPGSTFATRGVNPASFIHFEARLEPDVIVDPGVVIGPGVEIGTGTIVGANSVIAPGVRIGRNCAIGSQVTIAHALIGNGVIIRPGVRIGQDGPDYLGTREGAIRIAALGRVIIQDNVEIGANSTIDRGGLHDTVLGEGSRIGNLVHVSRDLTIGRNAVLRADRSGAGP